MDNQSNKTGFEPINSVLPDGVISAMSEFQRRINDCADAEEKVYEALFEGMIKSIE